MPDYTDITDEIEAGLHRSRKRRRAAKLNHDLYSYNFETCKVPGLEDRRDTSLPESRTPILRRVADVLCGNLYKSSPQRVLRDGVATEFLARVYKAQKMAAKWKYADALTLVGGYQAYQFAGGELVDAPVAITQWAPHELAVWTEPDDALTVRAVGTLWDYRDKRRLQLWTRESVSLYETDRKGDGNAPSKGNEGYEQVWRKDNPYRSVETIDAEGTPREGLIPFSFAHWSYPCASFTTEGPGDILAAFNLDLVRRLTNLSDDIEFQSRPIGWSSNVPATFKMPRKLKPGQFLDIVDTSDVVGNAPAGPAMLNYLSPPLGHVADNWQELTNRFTHYLEMYGVPDSAIRMVQSGAASGVAIQSEQLPLLTWAEGRRGDWSSYEEESARTCLQVAEAWTRINGLPGEADRIQGWLEDFQFSLRWPRLYTMLPGPERDRSDEWRMQQGLADKVQILMEREDLTEEEATAQLKKIAERKAALVVVGIDPEPFQQPSPFDPANPGQPRTPEQSGEPNPQQGQ